MSIEDIKLYVVTLKKKEYLEDFYSDMEMFCHGKEKIPVRMVECSNRRPISRNTHYYLTEEEADILKNDERVLSVEKIPQEIGIEVMPMYTQNENFWNKSSSNTSSHKNWGLLRIVEGFQTSGWGSDISPNRSSTIKLTSSGKNVDVVIVDGHFDPTHPEYAKNSDGTGGSRVIEYNWFHHNPEVTGDSVGNYVYTPYVDLNNATLTSQNNHGAHVAGTVAGNTQGWARDSNIYCINPYASNPNSLDALYIFDYIRAFHASKPVNPETGRKNPTITNNSWGYALRLGIASINQVVYRGNVINGPFTSEELRNYGIFNDGVQTYTPARYSALVADIEDAISDGIIMVAAGANDYTKVDIPGGLDYNNYYIWDIFTVFYHRGSSPGADANVICVGAVGSTSSETKATFSNCGPRIDIFAPGQNIMSAYNFGGTSDPRNSSYQINKISGTSMASPQVCGVLACVLEQYPDLNQEKSLEYLTHYSKKDQMTDTNGSYTDFTSLQGASNRYLFYHKERPDEGLAYPKINYKIRPSLGMVYPRPKIKR